MNIKTHSSLIFSISLVFLSFFSLHASPPATEDDKYVYPEILSQLTEKCIDPENHIFQQCYLEGGYEVCHFRSKKPMDENIVLQYKRDDYKTIFKNMIDFPTIAFSTAVLSYGLSYGMLWLSGGSLSTSSESAAQEPTPFVKILQLASSASSTAIKLFFIPSFTTVATALIHGSIPKEHYHQKMLRSDYERMMHQKQRISEATVTQSSYCTEVTPEEATPNPS